MPCDFCARPDLPSHSYGSLLCQRVAHALRTGTLTWNFATIVTMSRYSQELKKQEFYCGSTRFS